MILTGNVKKKVVYSHGQYDVTVGPEAEIFQVWSQIKKLAAILCTICVRSFTIVSLEALN